MNDYEYRTGLGWDIHALVPGDTLIIGGIPIPSKHKLEGHSDGDVLLHAITDALLGAAALDDIGTHFPSSNLELRDKASSAFLEHALGLVSAEGYKIENVDSTVIVQSTLLSPHRDAIRQSIAATLGTRLDQISVKFKTADKIGPLGNDQAAEAHAAVLLKRVPRLPSADTNGSDTVD